MVIAASLLVCTSPVAHSELVGVPDSSREATAVETQSRDLVGASEAIASLAEALKAKFPNNSEPTSINLTAVPGLYELLLGDQIAYVDASGTYFLFNAAMVDMKRQVNLTEIRKGELLSIDTSQFDIKDALVRRKGSGKNKLYLFSDPNCPFCQKLEQEIVELDDVTIITFMVPSPDARTVAESIWCAANPQVAWDDYMKSRRVPEERSCDNPIARNISLRKRLNVGGTPTLFAEDGRRLAGYVPVENIRSFMGRKKHSKANRTQ